MTDFNQIKEGEVTATIYGMVKIVDKFVVLKIRNADKFVDIVEMNRLF